MCRANNYGQLKLYRLLSQELKIPSGIDLQGIKTPPGIDRSVQGPFLLEEADGGTLYGMSLCVLLLPAVVHPHTLQLSLSCFSPQGMGVHFSARPDKGHNFVRNADILQLHHERVGQPHLHNHGTILQDSLQARAVNVFNIGPYLYHSVIFARW